MARGRKKKDTVEKKKIKKIKIVKSSDGKQPPITTFIES